MSEQTKQTCIEALEMMARTAEFGVIFAQDEAELAESQKAAAAMRGRVDAALAEINAPAPVAQGLDMPDGPGHWALKARIVYKNWHVEYTGTAYILPDDMKCKRVRIDGKMIDMSNIVRGKWTRLTMPWDAPAPPLTADVRETLDIVLRFAVRDGTDSTSMMINERIATVRAWLDAQPKEEPDGTQ